MIFDFITVFAYKMVRPVGFEPTVTIKILNKINTKKLVRSPLETLNECF